MLGLLFVQGAGPIAFSAAHAYAAMTVTAAVRGFLQRQRIVDEVLKVRERTVVSLKHCCLGYSDMSVEHRALCSIEAKVDVRCRELIHASSCTSLEVFDVWLH
eukprot:1147808-Pelagomonas_calceolata.AAC.2